MIYPVVFELAAGGIPVAVACRVLGASTSGYYDWRDRPPSPRAVADAALSETITAAHRASHGTYGSRRVHAELRLGQDIWVGRKRVERLMRCAGLQGVSRRRLRGCTRRDPTATPAKDLAQRNFTVEGPNKLWCADVTQHRTGEGWLYLAVVLDAYSRRWWAGRWPTTCAPSSSSTRCRWRCGSAGQRREPFITPTTGRRADSIGGRNTGLWERL